MQSHTHTHLLAPSRGRHARMHAGPRACLAPDQGAFETVQSTVPAPRCVSQAGATCHAGAQCAERRRQHEVGCPGLGLDSENRVPVCVREVRMDRNKYMLQKTNISITDLFQDIGYIDSGSKSSADTNVDPVQAESSVLRNGSARSRILNSTPSPPITFQAHVLAVIAPIGIWKTVDITGVKG